MGKRNESLGSYKIRYQDCTGADDISTFATRENAEAALRMNIESVRDAFSCQDLNDDGVTAALSSQDGQDWAQWTRLY